MIVTPKMLEDIHAWGFIVETFKTYWPNGVTITAELISALRIHIEKTIQPYNQKKDLSFIEDLIPMDAYHNGVEIPPDIPHPFTNAETITISL